MLLKCVWKLLMVVGNIFGNNILYFLNEINYFFCSDYLEFVIIMIMEEVVMIYEDDF